ncbi:MAG: cytochrome c3 family protein [Burkholderiaceae bacterium]
MLLPGPVIQAHAKWEADCKVCHVRFDRDAQSGLCMDCHKDIGRDVRDKSGYHGRMKPQACHSCHREHKGRQARLVEFDQRQFDHALTRFALRGQHQKAACEKCHEPAKKYRQAAHECNACHGKDDVHKGSLGVKCADCHAEVGWKDAKLDHATTRFPLLGKHAEVRCANCHTDKNFHETPRFCYACHRKDDDGSKGHKGLFGEKCETCHGPKGWKPPTFNHDTDTKFSLLGKHRSARCGACHTGPVYRVKLGTDCYACHQKDDKHKASLGRDCASCHTERDWKGRDKFDHDRTRFALRGKHMETRCDACHKSAVFKEAPKECFACHEKDDRHKTTLGRDCAACHTERDWKGRGRFDHARSSFPLLGKHADTRCGACHKSAMFKEAPKQCFACHEKDDKHKATLGRDCAACHTERDWKERGKFDHDRTGFALLGKHADARCDACHKSALFKEAPKECIACHRKDDKHEATLGELCATCHVERDWKTTTGRFDHDKTKFQLRNAHAALKVKCSDCHKDLRSLRKTALDCYSCHRKDDRHEGQQGRECASCHVDTNWKSVPRFDHGLTRFPLSGRHFKVECKACHASARFKDAKLDCVACHAKDDQHKTTLGTACESCHNARSWRVWDFDHDRRTKFMLDGRHKGVACGLCHTRPAVDAKVVASAQCVVCHTKNDAHDGSFGRQCQQCHATSSWRILRPGMGRKLGTAGPGPPSSRADWVPQVGVGAGT